MKKFKDDIGRVILVEIFDLDWIKTKIYTQDFDKNNDVIAREYDGDGNLVKESFHLKENLEYNPTTIRIEKE